MNLALSHVKIKRLYCKYNRGLNAFRGNKKIKYECSLWRNGCSFWPALRLSFTIVCKRPCATAKTKSNLILD